MTINTRCHSGCCLYDEWCVSNVNYSLYRMEGYEWYKPSQLYNWLPEKLCLFFGIIFHRRLGELTGCASVNWTANVHISRERVECFGGGGVFDICETFRCPCEWRSWQSVVKRSHTVKYVASLLNRLLINRVVFKMSEKLKNTHQPSLQIATVTSSNCFFVSLQ